MRQDQENRCYTHCRLPNEIGTCSCFKATTGISRPSRNAIKTTLVSLHLGFKIPARHIRLSPVPLTDRQYFETPPRRVILRMCAIRLRWLCPLSETIPGTQQLRILTVLLSNLVELSYTRYISTWYEYILAISAHDRNPPSEKCPDRLQMSLNSISHTISP